ncbi:testis-expressed sequence 264 protein [Pundamilia nyererei]|uniref:Testis expressed 264, ER-phagy receptor n=1 Tax=Pundamilia nyererei TaxID=303518 RepID=A0A3B4FD76_9CICH|nr:PREDICTED: testis-expressed sequence 264 protein [Pundamilia nyererei]
MSDLFLLLLIIVLLLCLVGTVGSLLLYSGVLSDIVIKTGPPPIRNVTIAYKFKEGPYKDCGAAYTESCSIGPKLNAIGVFYDDPKQRPPEKCRYVVGSILCEGEEKPDEDLQKLYEKFGFKVFSMPDVSHAVTTSFPCTTPLSHVLGPYRVYPRIASYIEERKLCAFPTIEIYSSDVINYMVPLSRQTDFFVPEMKEEVRTDVKEEDSDDDRGTDITGADSHSDVSSVSGGVPWDSRETSLAVSTAASMASSLPLRDVLDASEDLKYRDHSDRGSNDSVGSGSSFEELDMDQEELGEGEERVKKEYREEEDTPEGEGGAREGAELAAEKKERLGEGEE